MRGPTDTGAWRIVFAAGLLLRPVLIAPMAPGGPLGGSGLLPVALVVLFGAQVPLAVAVFVWPRPGIELGVITAAVGVPLALAGAPAGLPMPWPIALAAYNLALLGVGVRAWDELRRAGRGRAAPRP